MTHAHHRHCTDGFSAEEKLLHYLPDDRPIAACWLWDGTVHHSGHGVLKVEGKQWVADRLAYSLWVGEIPVGHTVASRCGSMLCLNPGHLLSLPTAERRRQTDSPIAKNARKTECVNGHLFTPENTYIHTDPEGRSRRACRECRREGERARYAEEREGREHVHSRYCAEGLTVEERLLHYLPDRPDGLCWLWGGSLSMAGYGVIGVGGKQVKAHRLAYETWVGPIPKGLAIDHVRAWGCVSRACCNPAHLEAVTGGENNLRGDSPWALNARKETCLNGHPFDIERRIGGRVYRDCSTCRSNRSRKHEASSRKKVG